MKRKSWDKPLKAKELNGKLYGGLRVLDNFKQAINSSSEIVVPRWVGIADGSEVQLHLFYDWSNRLYVARAYLVVRSPPAACSNLVAAKSRLVMAKLFKINISPRFELVICFLGVKSGKLILNVELPY